MTKVIHELYEKASVLPAEDRAQLASLLIDSLDDRRDSGVEEAWAKEIERRMAEYRAGRVRTISWQELRAHLHRSNR
jgi:putative addiction module component (TIGR02574 family)